MVTDKSYMSSTWHFTLMSKLKRESRQKLINLLPLLVSFSSGSLRTQTKVFKLTLFYGTQNIKTCSTLDIKIFGLWMNLVNTLFVLSKERKHLLSSISGSCIVGRGLNHTWRRILIKTRHNHENDQIITLKMFFYYKKKYFNCVWYSMDIYSI